MSVIQHSPVDSMINQIQSGYDQQAKREQAFARASAEYENQDPYSEHVSNRFTKKIRRELDEDDWIQDGMA